MRVFTAHTRPESAPRLVREGFSWLAFIFGPLWLLAHRAWLAAVLAICAYVLIALLPLHGWNALPGFGLSWLLGLFGQDIRRWSLERSGYGLAHVVAARDHDTALAQLLERRPDLIETAVR
ncbi:MAG TPA: DUF2628 domain-containing protein [Acetobacteraceae bacterium]|jgi:hypothetical protein|nr:DUF2628 domain-containing protein [Acetobacteraceae bacterium]